MYQINTHIKIYIIKITTKEFSNPYRVTTNIKYIYLYIYREREREKKRNRNVDLFRYIRIILGIVTIRYTIQITKIPRIRKRAFYHLVKILY